MIGPVMKKNVRSFYIYTREAFLMTVEECEEKGYFPNPEIYFEKFSQGYRTYGAVETRTVEKEYLIFFNEISSFSSVPIEGFVVISFRDEGIIDIRFASNTYKKEKYEHLSIVKTSACRGVSIRFPNKRRGVSH